ncbi:MAG: Abi family protein [Ignavibacteriaceae bacterium]|nr:Abi family protein [Ignavibacteriaceae bacterium]
MIYSKKALTFDEQITQLKQRGLIINDESVARSYLQTVGYYRLSGFWWPMLSDKTNRIFKPNSTFENVIAIYNFDKELRFLLFDVIETIEIVFRTKLIYHLSLELTPWWFEDAYNFKNPVDHSNTLISIDRELQQTKENFIKRHYLKYHTDNRRPPAWKTIEIASFGTLSKLYGNLKNHIKAKNIIAQEFGTVNHTYFPSWLQSISQIRNMVAHHSRLWNKNLPGRPRLLSKPPYPWLVNVPPSSEHYMLYIHLCCLKYLLNIVKPHNDMTNKLNGLLNTYFNIDPNALGIKDNWQEEPLWKS